jgi:hypothetical protein
VARRHPLEPPYWSAVQLAGWVSGNREWVRGALIVGGHAPGAVDGFTARDWLDCSVALIAHGDPATAQRLLTKLVTPLAPERETWGTNPQALAAYHEAERDAGGPAPLRERSES